MNLQQFRQPQWSDELHLSEGYAAAAEADVAPIRDDVFVATVRYPIVGRHLPYVVGKTEAQAKAALLRYWRGADRRRRRLDATYAEMHCIVMGFDPVDFPEKFSGLPFEVRSWEDLRRIYGASLYPVAFGEVFVSGHIQGTDDLVLDSIAYLGEEDEEWR